MKTIKCEFMPVMESRLPEWASQTRTNKHNYRIHHRGTLRALHVDPGQPYGEIICDFRFVTMGRSPFFKGLPGEQNKYLYFRAKDRAQAEKRAYDLLVDFVVNEDAQDKPKVMTLEEFKASPYQFFSILTDAQPRVYIIVGWEKYHYVDFCTERNFSVFALGDSEINQRIVVPLEVRWVTDSSEEEE